MPPAKRPCETDWQRRFLGLDVTHPQVQAVATEVEAWCGRVIRNRTTNSLLVLAGVSGTGKSHAAKCACNFLQAANMWALDHEFYDHPLDVALYRWPEVADGFKNGDFSILEDLFSLDAIILDDVGAEHDPSSLATDKLCQVFTRRETKFTLLTTNILPEHWAQRFDARVADRLLRNSVIVDLKDVDSYALQAP